MRKITFKGSPLTLVGRAISVGNAAPDFKVVNGDLKEISLSDVKGKIKIITSFPSIDTPVCDMQVKEFNKRASGFALSETKEQPVGEKRFLTGLASDIIILGISKDLPFAQKRFCASFDIKNITLLSDYKASSFGINYGVLIKELNLLARAVIIIDKNDVVRYIQIVEEVTTSPDYEAALKSLEEVIKSPEYGKKEELPARCKACEGGVPALPKEEIERLLARYRGWQLVEDKKITKEFKFKDFVEAKYFLDLISVIAEEQGHHPTMTIMYNKVKITLTTHSAGGLSENDFIMARIIDELGA